jgi:hypothetical protein
VGNRGTVAPEKILFSKRPEMHSRDLENSARSQKSLFQQLRKVSHFSSGTTGTTEFLLICIPQSTRRAATHCLNEPGAFRVDAKSTPQPKFWSQSNRARHARNKCLLFEPEECAKGRA